MAAFELEVFILSFLLVGVHSVLSLSFDARKDESLLLLGYFPVRDGNFTIGTSCCSIHSTLLNMLIFIY